jgi:hypothetical protein
VCWRGALLCHRSTHLAQRMFSDAHAFDQPVASWDVGKVTSMSVRRRPRRELEGLGWLARGHSFATRAPTWCGRVRCGATQGMFSRADALSDCNKLSTHTSFEAQNPSAWDYDWASVTCTTPSPPATPPEPPTSPPPPLLSEKASLEAALGEWCADAAAAQATHGPISAWDVSTVTDMASLLHGLTCSSTFDEDLNAWDVRQVTDMRVRRRPRREPEGLGTGGWPGGRSFATRAPTRWARAVWRDTGNVQLCELFQPACGSVGRSPGHGHGGAPLCPRQEPEGLRWLVGVAVLCHTLWSTHVGQVTGTLVHRRPRWEPKGLGVWPRAVLCHRSTPTLSLRVCGGAAQGMFGYTYAFNQPVAAWDVGQVTNMNVRRRPRWEPKGWGLGGWPGGGPLPHWIYTLEHPPTLGVHVRCGAAQSMFHVANAFNQPVAAWDVSHVNNMMVRHRPFVGSAAGGVGAVRGHSGGGSLPAEHPCTWRARAVACGAANVLLRERFQPALGSVGRRPGHQHDVYVQLRARFQPARGSVGRRSGHQHVVYVF